MPVATTMPRARPELIVLKADADGAVQLLR
jgi:hypothetical protein